MEVTEASETGAVIYKSKVPVKDETQKICKVMELIL